MKILFAGGGTAGHINPALSIANFIHARKPSAEIAFAGTRDGMEDRLVKRAGYPLYYIEVYGFKRSLSAYNIKAARHLLSSVREANAVLDAFAPDIVVGTGGYVSGPVLFAAARRHIPTAIHEQNAFPGVTSRILARVVDRVMISFEASRERFPDPEKLVLVGNPVREELLFSEKARAREKLGIGDKPLVVSFGGSLGARELNKRIVDFIALHSAEGRIAHIHATGKHGWKWVPDLLREKGVDLRADPDLRVVEYIDNMADVMAAADLLITRAGAITLAELAAMGKPSILIPSPNVTNNHQYHNAMAFVREGAAVLCEEDKTTGADLKRITDELVFDRKKLAEMGRGAARLAIPDSTQKIYDLLFELAKKEK